MFFLTGFTASASFGFSNVSFIVVMVWIGINCALSRLCIHGVFDGAVVRKLPNFLTGFDATCILWAVKHRLILSVSPGR